MATLSLIGKTALVTGSGRGLGYTIASRLAEMGADVAIHDISEEAPAQYGEFPSLTAAAAAMAQYGTKTTSVIGDISNEASVANIVKHIESTLGPISILVNCAGGDIGVKGTKPNPNTALEIAMDDLQIIINRNLIGTILMCRAICPGMRERRTGSVINIASVAAHVGWTPEVAYATAKAGIVHFSRCLAGELREHNVRINVVSPGPTATARFMATRPIDPKMAPDQPTLIRYGAPSDIADAILYLAGDLSKFVSGQVLRVDGGAGLYAA